MKLNGKTVNLNQLEAELAKAGIVINALGTVGDELFTYDKRGTLCNMPNSAIAIVQTHVPIAPINSDATLRNAITSATTLTQLKAALLNATTTGLAIRQL